MLYSKVRKNLKKTLQHSEYMKVISAQEMSHIEKHAFDEGASDEDFMEKAGIGIALAVHENVVQQKHKERITLLCGKGNNTGDAYVAGALLKQKGYVAQALQLAPIQECSPLCQKNHQRFVDQGGSVIYVDTVKSLPLPSTGVILDGIFGTGFHGKAEGIFAAAIAAANASPLPVFSIDIPSGLNGTTGEADGEAIQAQSTFFLGLPKTGFFLREGWNHVGRLRRIDFGLKEKYIEEAKEEFRLVRNEKTLPKLPSLVRNRHKYQAGYVVGIAGSPGMSGAAILSSYAALYSGAGIVRLLHPDGMQVELATAPYELIKSPYDTMPKDELIELLNKASALYIGPGFGRTQENKSFLKEILPHFNKACVLDADALYHCADKDISLPPKAILTPHHGEMRRLLGEKDDEGLTPEFLQRCQEYSSSYNVIIVLKGGPTFIFFPNEPPHIITHGSPGMATAGSGDILTGIITSLLSQGMTPRSAALLGTYIHGRAGEYTAHRLTPYCMVASDILSALPALFAEMM
jgi:ADP-dependent NAD(P)H-hydrate dehydratase / NAD(P)H-hydrate epimerase